MFLVSMIFRWFWWDYLGSQFIVYGDKSIGPFIFINNNNNNTCSKQILINMIYVVLLMRWLASPSLDLAYPLLCVGGFLFSFSNCNNYCLLIQYISSTLFTGNLLSQWQNWRFCGWIFSRHIRMHVKSEILDQEHMHGDASMGPMEDSISFHLLL